MPAVAFAQQAPPQGPMGMPNSAAWKQMRAIHEQFRSQVLGAITPAHRALLAQVVGNLAVSTNPDRRAAAQQLDAALSPAEKAAIFADAKAMRAQMRSARADMPKPPNMPERPRNGMREHHAPSAGAILLMAAHGGPR